MTTGLIGVRARPRWGLFTGTQVGLKMLMALSGALLTGWVVLHMIGNLLVFAGPEVINGYGAALQHNPLVWVMRGGLVLLVAVHVACALSLTRTARDARRTAYQRKLDMRTATIASRSMRYGGIALALFLVYHLLHIYGPLHASFVPGDVHHNLASAMRDPLVVSIYAAATIALGLHLWHGVWSVARTLGIDERYAHPVRRLAVALSTIVTIGFLAPAVGGLLGFL